MSTTVDVQPAVTNLADYLEATARRLPHRPAVVDPDGSILTYAELNDRANRIAGFLARRGVGRGDRVGLVVPKSASAVATLFGAMKLNAAYVPVDYTAPVERNRAILTDCAVKAAIVDRRCLGVFDEAPDLRPTVVAVIGDDAPAGERNLIEIVSWPAVLQHQPHAGTPEPGRLDDLAYILYTSGSTGVPKGVMLTHRNAISFVEWCSALFEPTEHDRFSSHAPFHFDLSVFDLYVCARHGATLFLISEELGKNPKELARFIVDRRLTVWYSTPSILSLLAQFGALEGLARTAPRLVLFAGEVFPVKHLRQLVALWPCSAYYNLYGPTETNVCTFARIPAPIPDNRTEPYPIGWACSHCATLVLDDSGALVPRGEEGLLYISGPSLFEGYWNRQEVSRKAFTQIDGVRWYNTGDVVREDPKDGFIYLGRRDRMVKRHGYRIELGEVESALYRCESLREAAVVADLASEGATRIIAYVTPRNGTAPSIVDLKVFCRRHLPAYMNPDIFVVLEQLPRTSTNKVDYQSLLKSFRKRKTGQ